MKTITGVLVALLLVSGICMADKAEHLYYQGYLSYVPTSPPPVDPWCWGIYIENNVGDTRDGGVAYVAGQTGAFYSVHSDHYFAQLYSPVRITVVLYDTNYEPMISAYEVVYWGPDDYDFIDGIYYCNVDFHLP